MSAPMREVVVIVPTYEERENIGRLLSALRRLSVAVDVLVVDDHSPDKTADVVLSYQKKHPEWGLHLLCRRKRKGLGAAYRAGFRFVLERDYQYIIQMDADFSHNPRDILPLLSLCRETKGLVVGSRYVKGVNVVNWPMGRIILSYTANCYIRFVTGMTLHDATSGFVCYHRAALRAIAQRRTRLTGGYAFQIASKFEVWKHGFPVREVSIIFTDRTRGRSKMSRKIFWEAFFAVVQMRLNSFFIKYAPRPPTD